MDIKRITKKYENKGLRTKYIQDKPGKIYKPHSHGKVKLYSIAGSVKIRRDNKEWQTINPGEEIIIKRHQVHEAIVGANGWEYIFAWDENEAKKYGIDS